jgi:hypothetical protein
MDAPYDALLLLIIGFGHCEAMFRPKKKGNIERFIGLQQWRRTQVEKENLNRRARKL